MTIEDIRCSCCGKSYSDDSFMKDPHSGQPIYYKADPESFKGKKGLKPLEIYCSPKCSNQPSEPKVA